MRIVLFCKNESVKNVTFLENIIHSTGTYFYHKLLEPYLFAVNIFIVPVGRSIADFIIFSYC